MQAVMFASRRKGLTFRLEEGQQVVVKGSIEVYERDGRYQLYAARSRWTARAIYSGALKN